MVIFSEIAANHIHSDVNVFLHWTFGSITCLGDSIIAPSSAINTWHTVTHTCTKSYA